MSISKRLAVSDCAEVHLSSICRRRLTPIAADDGTWRALEKDIDLENS
jgi:hypothetical protein